MIDKVKDKVQKEAMQAVIKAGGRGIVVKATGTGKSRVPILYAKKKKITKIALIVPTEELRDDGWEKEFKKWKADELYKGVHRYCYASAHKIFDEDYELVILDECHHITPLSGSFFDNNKAKDIIALTATLPTDPVKKDILMGLGLNPVYTVSIDDAQEMDLVAPFKIKVIYTQLNRVIKDIPAGNKAKPFMTTEYGQYTYISRCIAALSDKETDMFGNPVQKFLTASEKAKLQMLLLKRMRFIYNLKSKTIVARKLISSIEKTEKVLIFCGSIEQAEDLCPYHYHSKIKKSNNDLELFKNDKINRLSCVNALNEGVNISNLDVGIITQLNSKELNLVQRIGRIIRKRPGHEAVIYILCCKGTQDEVWLQKSLKNFDAKNIEYLNYVG